MTNDDDLDAAIAERLSGGRRARAPEDELDAAITARLSGRPAAAAPVAQPAVVPGQTPDAMATGAAQKFSKATSGGIDALPREEWSKRAGEMNPAGVAFLSGVYETFGGLKQVALDTLETVGLVPHGTSDRMRVMTDAELDDINEALRADLGSDIGFKIANIGGKMVPSFAIPGGPGGSGLIAGASRLLASAASGALFGAAEVSDKPLEERMQDRAAGVKAGAIAGIGTGAVMEPFSQFRGAAAKMFKSALDSDYAREGLRLDSELRKLSGDQVGLKLSQITGDPFFEGMEAGARSAFRIERIARNMEQAQQKTIWNGFRSLMDSMIKGPRPFGEAVQSAFDKTVDSLVGIRRGQAAADFGAVQKALGNAVDAPVIPIDNFRSALQDMLDRIPERGADSAQLKLRAELASMLGQFSVKSSKQMAGLSGMQTVTIGSRQASVKELQALLAGFGDSASGKGAAFKDLLDAPARQHVSKKLFGALMDDLDAAAQSGQRGAELLKIARDNYRANSEPLQALRETAIGRFLGETGIPKTPLELEKQMMSMERDQLLNGLQLLRKADPALHRNLQRFWLERTMMRVNETRQTAEFGNLNTRKLLELIDPDGKFDAIYPDPAMRERVLTGLALVGRIQRNAYNQGRRLMPYLKESAGIVASRSPIFAARWASEMFTPRVMARYLDSKDGLAALREMEKPFNANRWAAAMGTLKNIAYPTGEPEE